MKRLLLAPLLISISLLNIGFIFKKNEIKGIICGQENFFKTLRENFVQKNIYKQSQQVFAAGGLVWFFDAKTGKLYDYEKYSDSLKPFYEEKTNNGKYIFTYKGSIDKNKLKITSKRLLENREQDPNAGNSESTEIYYLDEMVHRYEYDGKQYKQQCEYFPIPKEVKKIIK